MNQLVVIAGLTAMAAGGAGERCQAKIHLGRSSAKTTLGDGVVAEKSHSSAAELRAPSAEGQQQRRHLEGGDLRIVPGMEQPGEMK